MIGASKILTVSYGTFSCTLEGFDEPFNTMKAIAEYFRDLAADDRYFGAEPPTPDAAMLHRIAEREIQRRVEAKIGDNGVHLRAQENAAELPAPQPTAPDVVPEPAILPTLTAMPEGVAARLAKIRASVAQGDAEIVPVAAVAAAGEFTEDQHADALVEDMASFAMFDDAEIVPVDVPADLPPVATATPAMAQVEDPPAEAPVLADDGFDDDMLTDLAAQDAPLPPQESVVAESADAPADDDAGFDIADLDLGTDEPEVPATPVEAAQDDDLSARLGALIDPEETAQDINADAAPAWDAAAEDDMLADLDMEEPVVEAAAEAVAETEPAADHDIAEVDAATDAVTEPDVPAETAAAEPEPAPVVSEKIQRARARVIRIRRNAEIAVSPPVEAPVEPAATAAAEPEPAPTPTLTDDAEAELARELAALEGADTPVAADNPADDDADLRRQLAMIEDDAAAIAVDPPVEPVETPAHAAIADAVQDAAVSRLMQQTQSEMAVPENRRRLSAIAHLKAAVAATVAERFGTKAKTDDVEATRAEPYRDDLARVVRPRRPESAATAAPARPAPLVLVSEQRIDRPAPPAGPATITPVRPRRVSSAALAPQLVEDFDEDEDDDDDNIFTDAKGFAEFADRLGAHSLPDMLEAAAAYAATVEGRPSFSRPQLMRQVSLATGEADVSREDGLRSFGTLLRDGRIIKVRRGLFALTDQSRFLTEAKKITD